MKTVVTELLRNEVFPWSDRDGVRAKGYAYTPQGEYISGPGLAAYICKVGLRSCSETLGGCWSAVDETGVIKAAQDMNGTFPLFYAETADRFVITDHIAILYEKYGFSKTNDTGACCFSMCGYVPGKKTLVNGVFTLNAGEILKIEEGTMKDEISRDYDYPVSDVFDYEEEKKKALAVFEETFHRFIKSLNNRTAIIPLSGGFDSRLIAAMLKMGGYENVIYWSYGKINGFECEKAHRISKQLGHKWVHTATEPGLYDRLTDQQTLDYILYAANGRAAPVLIDYYFLRRETERKGLPSNGVVTPGHSGDLSAGSCLPLVSKRDKPYVKTDIVNFIYKKLFQYRYVFSPLLERTAKKEIRDSLLDGSSGDYRWMCRNADVWNIRNRQSKMILNGLRTQEALGYEWQVPLWDKQISEYWYRLAPQARQGRFFYDKLLSEEIFAPLKIDFPRGTLIKYLKKHGNYKKVIPLKMRQLYKIIKGRTKGYPDVNNLSDMVEILSRTAGIKIDPKRDHSGRIMAAVLKMQIDHIKKYEWRLMKIGILSEFDGLHKSYTDACKYLGVEYETIDFVSDRWFENITESGCRGLLVRPSARRTSWKRMYDERLYFIDKYTDKILYPSYEEILLYENKRAQSYWMRINSVPAPETGIFYDKAEALKYLSNLDEYPIVFKTNLGSAASGLKIIRSKKQGTALVKQIFSRTGIGFKGVVKWGKGPLNIKYPIIDDIQYNNVMFQKYIDLKTEWRGVRIGESYFLHKKEPGRNKLRSGSYAASYGVPPFTALDFLKTVCDKGRFRSMNVDFFETRSGEYLVNEMHTVFASKINEYQTSVDGKPGRYIRAGGSWKFEEGEFNKFDSNVLRVRDLLRLLNGDSDV